MSPSLPSGLAFLAVGMLILADAQQAPMDATFDTMMNNETTILMNETSMMNETMLNNSMYDDMVTTDENIVADILPEDIEDEDSEPSSTSQFSIIIPPPTSPAPTMAPPSSSPTGQPTVPAVRNCVSSPVTDEEIQVVRAAIVEFIEQEDNINYPAKFVRLGFHDCVGGCDGCVDMSDPENAGLEVPIEGLAGLVAEFENECISRADIWSLAALVGAEFAQRSIGFPMVWVGRRNCGAEDPMNGPAALMPSADMDVHGLLDFFSNEFGFGPQQVVALMGAHSIGSVDEDNSGFVGRGWDDDNEELDNDYYRQLRDNVRWNQVNANRRQWEGGDGGSGDADVDGIIMLNVDIALVRDFSADLESDGEVNCRFRNRGGGNGGGGTVCPNAAQTRQFVEDYQLDNNQFLNDFRDVLSRMLVNGYDTSNGCDSSDPCPFPGAFASVSRTGLQWDDYWV